MVDLSQVAPGVTANTDAAAAQAAAQAAAAPKPAKAAKPGKRTAAATVQCKVLKAGAGKIFTGETNPNPAIEDGETRFPTYDKGEVFTASADVAARLEDAGLVDVLGGERE